MQCITSVTMLLVLFVLVLVTSIECVEIPPDIKPNDRVVVKLDTDQVVEAFQSVVSTDYLRNLAHELAARAADHFLAEMNSKQRTTESPPKMSKRPRYVAMLKSEIAPPASNSAASIKEEVLQEIERTPSQKNILPSDLNTSIIDVKQAMTLLKDPSPDGDNLDLVSPNLSEDEETKEKNRGTPVIQLLKINGKYFRRLIGFV